MTLVSTTPPPPPPPPQIGHLSWECLGVASVRTPQSLCAEIGRESRRSKFTLSTTTSDEDIILIWKKVVHVGPGTIFRAENVCRAPPGTHLQRGKLRLDPGTRFSPVQNCVPAAGGGRKHESVSRALAPDLAPQSLQAPPLSLGFPLPLQLPLEGGPLPSTEAAAVWTRLFAAPHPTQSPSCVDCHAFCGGGAVANRISIYTNTAFCRRRGREECSLHCTRFCTKPQNPKMI